MLHKDDYCLLAKPNCSISPRGMIKVMGLIAAVSLLVAVGFSIVGAWLVLPFAGLELVALGLAFYYMHLHASDFERIAVEGDIVSVTEKNYREIRHQEFNRYWAKLKLYTQPNGDQVVALRSHGKELAVGKRFLSNEQRLALAEQLRARLGG